MHLTTGLKQLLLLVAAVSAATAQIGYPGGYPPVGYPPGGNPGGYPPGYPGQYPGTGPGIPIPGGSRQPKGSKKTSSKDTPQVLPNFRGKLKAMDAKNIRLQLDDDRVLEFRVTGKTKYVKNGDEIKSPKFNAGDQISVEASEEPDGSLTAVNVYWEKAAAAGEVSQTKDSPLDTWKDVPKKNDEAPPRLSQSAPPPRDPDDPGPPSLKRGKPVESAGKAEPELVPVPAGTAAATSSAPPEAPKQVAVNLPAVNLPQINAGPENAPDQSPLGSHQEDPLIRKATEAALEFTETLPNYVCQEMMARFESESKTPSWNPLDVVTVEVIYENGRERYRNVAINGKATNKKIEEVGGSWSTGEFGTILIDLFSPATAADFRRAGSSRIAGIDAKLYDFSVARENSHWTLHFGPQTYEPAYSGRVWIDPETARVLRIEMQGRDLPKDFPTDHVESATEYQYVRFGGKQQFLLPVHSETLSCARGSSACSKNSIDFRNYHKYTGESSIEFEGVKK